MRAMPCNLASCYTRGCQEKQSLLSWGGGETVRGEDAQDAQNICSHDTKNVFGFSFQWC